MEPCTFVIFGATGNLARNKLLPALYHLEQAGRLPGETALVGVGRREWSDEQWRRYVASEDLHTFVAFHGGSLAGYFELREDEGDVEIAYFGLAPEFIGRGLGGALLTRALEAAWQLLARPSS